MNEKRHEFVAEAEELMDDALASLMEIQETLPSPNPDLVNGIFRAMHTLKGMSGLFGFQGLSDISHHLESLLDLIRLGKADISLEVLTFIFRCFDSLKVMLNKIRDNAEQDRDAVEAMLNDIESFVQSLSSPAVVGIPISFPKKYRPILKVLSEYEEHRLNVNVRGGNAIYLVTAIFQMEEFDVLLKELSERVKPLGEIISTMPTSDSIPEGSIGFHVIVASAVEASEIENVAGYEVSLVVAAQESGPPSSKEDDRNLEKGQSLKSSSTTVRVDISKVDSILDTIADLSLSRQSVFNIWQSFVSEHGNTPLSIDLYRVTQSMHRRLALLQNQVLEIRMVPVGSIFSRLERVVKRYSAGAGKKIRLDLFGEETEIDKFVAEEIVDPLMHVVRNAIDHGIEDEKERLKAGKPQEGLLELKAYQRGNNVIISVKDDGRGINPDKIRVKAIERGIIGEGDRLERPEVLDLMFLPGLSTADAVSETSGRGVGLDVVKDKMSLLGGAIEVPDEQGGGASFILTLPITLSLIRALMVRAGQEVFAVPLSSMSETLVAEKDEMQEIEGRLTYNLRGEMLPLYLLGELLEFDDLRPERYFAVIVGHGDRRIGLLVDEFLGQQEIVIKPLGEYFEGIRGYAGASEIGRHKVILVLDTEALISDALQEKKTTG